MKAVAILLTVLLLGGAVAQAQQREKDRGHALLSANSEGRHFFVGFMQNEDPLCGGGNDQRVIMVASRFANTVVIRFPDGRVVRDVLKANELHSYEVPYDYECVGEGVFRNGIEIQSDRPVCVYCYSSKLHTSDGYLALPLESWGREYVSANFDLDQYRPTTGDSLCTLIPRRGEFAIIASEDNTQVNVYPATQTLESRGARLLTRTLMKGEIYQVQDGGWLRGYTDLTGSVISSDKPVGVLSGHMRAAVPYFYESKDHLIEMLPPRNTHGKRHIVVPFGGRLGGDIVRVIASHSGVTNVTINSKSGPITRTITDLGGFVEYDLLDVAVITTDRPVLVTQYSKSQGADPRNQDSGLVRFDPDMVVVTPEEQFVQTALFQTMPNFSLFAREQQYVSHYVTLVGERSKFSTIRLNGQPLTDQPGYVAGDVAGTEFRWASMRVGDGRVHVLSGEALFGGYVYGLGKFDSYAWPVGARLRKTDDVDSTPPWLQDSIECGGVFVRAFDSGAAQSGLKSIRLDSAASVNVTFSMTPLMLGDEYAEVHLKLINPRASGKARIIVEDQAGNSDTQDIDVPVNTPLAFSRDSIFFRNVEPNVTYSQVLTITNPNASVLTVDDVSLRRRKEFTLLRGYQGIVLRPGASADIEVLFQTAARTEHRDTIVIRSACQTYTIPLYARVSAPQIATHDLEFGVIRVGRDRTLDLRVWNPGLVPLRLDSAVIAGEGFTIAVGLADTVILPPGEDTTIAVAFKPPRVGDFVGAVRFYSNADTVAIARLHGVGVYPEITISGHDFGRIQVGDTACARVAIVNTGSDTAFLTGLGLPDPNIFIPDTSAFPFALPPGDTLWVGVCFVPVDQAIYTSDVLPLNSDGLEAKNTLRGAGYRLSGWIGGYDWGRRWIGPTWHDTVVFIHNSSDDPLTIDRVWIGSGDVGDFKVEALAAPVSIAARDSMPVNVSFSPLLPGLRSCLIHASTSSRTTPVIDSVLLGFGLMAMASDSLTFDDALAYSCGARRGSLRINNDGNTVLTLRHLDLTCSPNLAVLDGADPSGYSIPPGESLIVNFNVTLAGYVGDVSGSITWSFEELPDTIRRDFAFKSAEQRYSILATTPPSIGIGGKFSLVVRVDSVFWQNIGQREATISIKNNPTVARFDLGEWAARSASVVNGWVPVGLPVVDKTGLVTIRFKPSPVDPLPLDSVIFLAFPYEGFLGNSRTDSFGIVLTPGATQCGPPAFATIPYQVDSICGLSNRLIQMTGGAYALKPSRPNPAGTTATLDFTLGMESYTTLQLFSSDGRLVRTLVDGILPAGNHSVTVEVRTLQSGLYYYRLTSGPYGAVRPLTVAK